LLLVVLVCYVVHKRPRIRFVGSFGGAGMENIRVVICFEHVENILEDGYSSNDGSLRKLEQYPNVTY